MQLAFWVRRAHKWIGLLIGVQALLWMISGLYMVVVPLEVIHGDHLAHVPTERLNPSASRITQAQLHESHPGITSIRLKVLLCLLYTSPSPRDRQKSRMPSSA